MKKLTFSLIIMSSSLCSLAVSKPIDQNSRIESNNPAECDPPFKIEGMNDAKGEYNLGNESWTIQFNEDGFIAFQTKDGKQEDSMTLKEIKSFSKCKYGIMMEGIEGEIVPSWTLVYNETEKYYDLHVHSYNATTDKWSDQIFKGNSDNG